uniref:Uncharacterized protein n=1 Tax=Meloidogyne javanica TaxID=6303 RepID=A0A915MKV2_MELJA
MFFFLVFSLICIEYAVGGGGEGGSEKGKRYGAEGAKIDKGTGKHPKDKGPESSGSEKLLRIKGAGSSGNRIQRENKGKIQETQLLLELTEKKKNKYQVKIHIERSQKDAIKEYEMDPEPYGDVAYKKRSGKFKVAEGQLMTKDWLNKGDTSKWMVEGKSYQNEIFEHPFDDHIMDQKGAFDDNIMVVLHEPDGEERFRIHYTKNRLNLFDSVNKINYFVEEQNGELVITPEDVEKNRDTEHGTTSIDDKFYSRGKEIEVFTHQLTLNQLLNIAYYKVIAGLTSDDKPKPFKSLRFVYGFVTAIAKTKFKKGLLKHKNWPENIRVMDEKIAGNKGKTAFKKSSQKLEELAEL